MYLKNYIPYILYIYVYMRTCEVSRRLLFTFSRFMTKPHARIIQIIGMRKFFSSFFLRFSRFLFAFLGFWWKIVDLWAIFVVFCLLAGLFFFSFSRLIYRQTRIRRSACACCNECFPATFGNCTSSLSPRQNGLVAMNVALQH